MKKLKLLVVAPGASSQDVGEVLLAYHWIKSLSKHYAVTVLTLDLPHIPAIEKTEDLDVDVIKVRCIGAFPKYPKFNHMLKPWYPAFYIQARKWIKANQKKFDWVHQLNPFAMRYPSPALGLDLPFSFGPVAGGLSEPAGFQAKNNSEPWFVKLRQLDNLRSRFDPLLKKTYEDAQFILIAAPYVKEIINIRYPKLQTNFHQISELGIDEIVPRKKTFLQDKNFRMLFVGRLIKTKGIREVILALPELIKKTDYNISLDILGTGEEQRNCQQLVERLDLHSSVTFHGRVPLSTVEGFYELADLMVFPSYREPTGGVVVEALKFGVPQLVLDYGGPASHVNETASIKIPPFNLEQLPNQIAARILENLSKAKFEQMSKAAHKLATQEYLWEEKIKNISNYIK